MSHYFFSGYILTWSCVTCLRLTNATGVMFINLNLLYVPCEPNTKFSETAIQIPGRHLVHHVRKNLASQGDIAATLDDWPWYKTRSSFCWWHGYPSQNDHKSHLEKRKILQKSRLGWDMLLPWRVRFFFFIFFSLEISDSKVSIQSLLSYYCHV